MATFISNSPAETEAIARQIAEDLVAGYVLALTGVRWLGAITPLGGIAFILGWAFLAIAAL